MDKQRIEITAENTQEAADRRENADDVRTLRELEMVLVGGGNDAVPAWP